MLDAQKYPRASAYFEALPDGFASYPGCLVRSDLFAPIFNAEFTFFHDDTIPNDLQNLLHSQPLPKWMPEVFGATLLLMLRDTEFSSDAKLHKWLQNMYRRIYSLDKYSIILKLNSPLQLITTCAKRWSTFHKGSCLATVNTVLHTSSDSVQGILEYPDYLFTKPIAEYIGQGFISALELSKAKAVTFEINDVSPTHTTYQLHWQQ